jgi:hypothetical protein
VIILLSMSLNENKVAAKANDKLTVEWKKNKKKLETYLHHDGSPLMKYGKAVAKVDVLKFKELVIMCHCWQNKHRLNVGGAVCLLQCKDPVSGKQYKLGECPVCLCGCGFVCMKKKVYQFFCSLSIISN